MHNNRKDDHGMQKAIKLLPIAVAFAGIVATWTALNADNSMNKADIKNNEVEIEATNEKLGVVKETVVRIEVQQEQVIRQQQEMRGDLKDILSAINRRNGD